MTRVAIIAAISSILLSGCITDEKITNRHTTGTAVRFSSSIRATRAYNDIWEPDDRIGVYMLPSPPSKTDWSAPSSAPIADNRLYAHAMEGESKSVVFTGVGDENIILWPDDGSAVDFVAYYPWRPSSEIAGFVYPVDLTDQSVQKDIDLMYSRNLTGVTEGNPALDFEHKLTKLVFSVTDLDQLPLDGMTAAIEGLPQGAVFDLATGLVVADPEAGTGPFDALLVSTSDGDPDSDADDDGINESAVVEAIVLPGEGLDYSVEFVLASGDKALFRIEGARYEAGKRYIYDDIVFSSKSGEKVDFGTDGAPSSITGWEDVRDDGGPYDITKNDDGGSTRPRDGEKGETWSSGLLVADPVETMYIVSGEYREAEGGGYSLDKNQEITIVKTNYQGGIVSIDVNMRCSAVNGATIKSVKVGENALVYGGDAATEVDIREGDNTEVPFTFSTRDGKPVSGQIEINIAGSGPMTSHVNSFNVN